MSSDNCVRVRHTSGVEKDVKPQNLKSLSPQWSRVSKRTTRKRSVAVADESQPQPAVVPDDSQEG